jgi:hypothetical protein
MKNSNFFAASLPTDFALPEDEVAMRLLHEYGAMYVARGGAVVPLSVVFRDEEEVDAFQNGVEIAAEKIGVHTLELQAVAMRALGDAVSEAQSAGLDITSRGKDSARRNYEDTVGLWASRVEPALDHWTGLGRLDSAKADHIRNLSPYDQVPEIFALEAEGMFCARDLSKSIVYSVAPPGTSQHLAMLAIDVAEFNNPAIREILARHYWYQTVVSDLPHFTYLGVPESDLPGLGLKKVIDGERVFWVPDISPAFVSSF